LAEHLLVMGQATRGIGKRADVDELYEAALGAAPHSVYSRESYLFAIDSR
jgi:hypothetical protein